MFEMTARKQIKGTIKAMPTNDLLDELKNKSILPLKVEGWIIDEVYKRQLDDKQTKLLHHYIREMQHYLLHNTYGIGDRWDWDIRLWNKFIH